MNFSLKIIESDKQIERAVLHALLPATIIYMNNVVGYIKDYIIDIIKQSIVSQPEYESLTKGSLRLELGIPDAENKISELLLLWINNIEVKYVPPNITNHQIKSTLSINMIKTDFSDVLGTSSAEVRDNISGSAIPWLQWLLLDGGSILVAHHSVIIGPDDRSRTGNAIMRRSKNSWSVPPEFSGTIANNWITRAIDSARGEINTLLEKALSQ